MSKRRRSAKLAIVPPPSVLGVRVQDGLAVREQTERALQADPEELELEQGLRRGASGELWSAPEAAQALAGARNTRELLKVTKELLPIQVDPGAPGLARIDKPKAWRQLLEEHPPDNAPTEDTTEPQR